MAREQIRDLEVRMFNKVTAARERRNWFSDDAPLTADIFTEILSGSGFFNTHGVMTRRMGVIGLEAEKERLASSVRNIGITANSGSWPTLDEIRDILHPPFDSFGAVAVGLPDNVICVDFTTGQVVDQQLVVEQQSESISA